MKNNSKILIVGHDDIIENSLRLSLASRGYPNIFSSTQLGLNAAIQVSVYDFFQKNKPDYVFLGSTRSGGIEANRTQGAEFLYHNLESQNNIVYASRKFGVKKLLYYASSCVYPRMCAQPMKEEDLLTGPLEPTSEPYAVAKIAGIKLCQAYKKQYGFNAIVAIPATVYGPGSDARAESGHVIGALIGKFTRAVEDRQKEVVVWGSGTPKREFLYTDDFISASLLLMERYDGTDMVNIGCGSDVTIKELARMIADCAGFKGNIRFDTSKPDGTMQKLLDNHRITALGWKPKVVLPEGIKHTYDWYQNKLVELKG